MIVKLPFQSLAILILFFAEMQHQDKGADRKHQGWEEKRRPRIERNPDDQGKRDQVGQQGQPGTRLEVESMGRSLMLVSEINDRTVVLTCFGDLELFDEIAVTLGSYE